jgi:hypothetical protein
MVRIIGIGFSQNNKTRDELKSPVRKSFNNPMGAGKFPLLLWSKLHQA